MPICLTWFSCADFMCCSCIYIPTFVFALIMWWGSYENWHFVHPHQSILPICYWSSECMKLASRHPSLVWFDKLRWRGRIWKARVSSSSSSYIEVSKSHCIAAVLWEGRSPGLLQIECLRWRRARQGNSSNLRNDNVPSGDPDVQYNLTDSSSRESSSEDDDLPLLRPLEERRLAIKLGWDWWQLLHYVCFYADS